MGDTVIRVENLWKEYRLGAISHHTLTHDLQSWWAKVWGKEDPNSPIGSGLFQPKDRFWALHDISFEVKQGDILGIIGRNGAGKSTLLKILSQVTAPTRGEVRFKGRIASLLEVGTGFHPELTGRENIFLNGAILGMSKGDIRKKLDEIIAFAEVDRFVDTPVKRYSSGMYVRLAFAVAAHLEPEILIVDEVLAVGDAQFQKKCLGKMKDVGKEGRTVLFVSHNMQAVKHLCTNALLLSSGQITEDGITINVINRYLNETPTVESYYELSKKIQEFTVDPVFKLVDVQLSQGKESVFHGIMSGVPLEIELNYIVKEKVTGLRVYFDLIDIEGNLLFRSYHDEIGNGIPIMMPGEYVSKASIPANLLGPTGYHLAINAGIYGVRRCIPAGALQIPIFVEATGVYNKAYLGDTFYGKLALAIPWETYVK